MGDDPGYGDDLTEWGGIADDMQRMGDDTFGRMGSEESEDEDKGDTTSGDGDGDGDERNPGVETDDADGSFVGRDDDEYPRYDDGPRHDDENSRYHSYDDFYSGRYTDQHEDYFDDKHYIRLPPHILCTPVLAELPKLYTNNGETENLLILAVSYYFDEDEYEGFFSYKRFDNADQGDETETQRGMYTANAIMIFHLGDNPRWGECSDSKILKF